MSTHKNVPSYSDGHKELRSALVDMLPAQSLNLFDSDADALASNFENILKLTKGDTAPQFSLINAIGSPISLKELNKSSNVVLVFYRGTWCPYCNLALSQYQEILPQIREQDAVLVAVSPQTPDESLTFKEKNNLDYEVLSDNGNMVARMYTTVFKNGSASVAEMTKLGFDFNSFYSDDSQEIPVPAVFIISKSGTVVFAESEGGDYRNRLESAVIINTLKTLNNEI